MSYIFSKKEYKNFHENGFLLKRSFFENSLCNSLIKDLEEIEHQNIIKSKNIRTAYLKKSINQKKYLNGMTYLQRADLECQTVKRFMNLKLLKACSELLKEEDIFFNDNEIHIRHTGEKHVIPAHQDNFYFSLEKGKALTCYVFLTNQNRNSGGLGFLPSNTEIDTKFHEKSAIEGFSSFNPLKEKEADYFEYPETRIGDVIFHHCKTFHRADPNSSDQPTIAISIRAFSSSNLKKDEEILNSYEANLKFNKNEK